MNEYSIYIHERRTADDKWRYVGTVKASDQDMAVCEGKRSHPHAKSVIAIEIDHANAVVSYAIDEVFVHGLSGHAGYNVSIIDEADNIIRSEI